MTRADGGMLIYIKPPEFVLRLFRLAELDFLNID